MPPGVLSMADLLAVTTAARLCSEGSRIHRVAAFLYTLKEITWQIYFDYRRVKQRPAFAKANSHRKLWYALVLNGSIHGNHKSKHGSIWTAILPWRRPGNATKARPAVRFTECRLLPRTSWTRPICRRSTDHPSTKATVPRRTPRVSR